MAANKKRTTKTQFRIFLDFLTKNPILRTGRSGFKEGCQETEDIWKSLTQTLNSCGDGPVRNQFKWKKVFTEWKSATRKKKRENKDLTDIEKLLFELTLPPGVDGLAIEEINIKSSGSGTESPVMEQAEEEAERESTGSEEIKKQHVEKITSDILIDAYVKAINSQNGGMNDISSALRDIACAINRFCDLTEYSLNKI